MSATTWAFLSLRLTQSDAGAVAVPVDEFDAHASNAATLKFACNGHRPSGAVATITFLVPCEAARPGRRRSPQ